MSEIKFVYADLITGFLGAGKTTFIRMYAEYLKKNGTSYAIIENEYGAAGVDAESLADTGAVIKEISGGCVCCTLKVGFHDLLLSLSEEFERIIIEPSGVFDPKVYTELLESPSLCNRLKPGMAVAVVDPVSLSQLTPEDLRVLQNEVRPAGGVLLSKTQFCTPEQIARAKDAVNSIHGGRFIEVREWSSLGGTDFHRLQNCGFNRENLDNTAENHTNLYQSATFTSETPLNKADIERFTEGLSGTGGEILRVKGFVRSTEGGMWFINRTPGTCNIVLLPERHTPKLNFIGRGLRRDLIRQLLCPREQPETKQ